MPGIADITAFAQKKVTAIDDEIAALNARVAALTAQREGVAGLAEMLGNLTPEHFTLFDTLAAELSGQKTEAAPHAA
jgi:hypothetical protein